MHLNRPRSWIAAAAAATMVILALIAAPTAQAAPGCRVEYTVTNQWSNGFGVNVSVINLGDPLTGWRVTWSFTAGQTITQLWNGAVAQSGTQVAVSNAAYNGSLATGASTSFGFNGSWNGSANPVPSDFALNGTPCTGGSTPTATPTVTPTVTPTGGTGTLPSSFRWRSTGALIAPKPDAAHSNIAAVKDPSVVYHNGRWHVFASTASSAGYNLVYTNFTDWAQAGAAQHHYLDQSAIGTGYRAAPQVFYFAPQNRWYLVYQTGNASYSTTTDISNPRSWSAPQHFYSSMPDIIRQNIGSGYWVDMWVICDTAKCYLFSSDDNGHLYRSETTVANFPNGFTNTQIVLQDSNKYRLWEASNIYKVKGTNQYLLLVEAIGSDGRRYFRSWTSTSIGGTWTPLADTESNPFARANNVTFDGTAWTRDISHGEMIRDSNDQTLTISPCQMRYLYQGMDPNASGDYNSLPWRLALLTQTNSTC
ncbi:non-reducing end alpha-L-arabinofuranosidase family hydrolase [Nonomuraea turcica]|uniref:non-reducing end alpha-L-arabinofuranosidase family hydrolase n=1 Tax=Nonomuraea sp. G32 TaxID=3067274 RepID=UPI00273AA51E|nr:non-reducing end alpha-L-arabinofuranosidase family hydrolase [Nonomuraea sp. G32]MDP4507769.1 non-reducing end alpha-L-arabinofuranosidase family hydrolase [Nonomuraea sp. G32]